LVKALAPVAMRTRDAGHAAQFQYPERFLKHAIKFLEE
jgi:hypothetical protein